MGLKLPRNKKRNLLLSLIYRINKLRLLNTKTRLKLFSTLEWIFGRLAHEESFIYYKKTDHPVRINTINFLSNFLSKKHEVFDLGTHQGDLAVLIAPLVKNIIGIDYENKNILIAKRKHVVLNVEFIHMEANEFLKINKKTFDVLILSHILEHLDNPKIFLNNIKSFFKYIYVEVPDFEATNHNKYRIDSGSSLIYTDVDHIHEFDRKDIFSLFGDLNIDIIASEFKHGVQRHWCLVK